MELPADHGKPDDPSLRTGDYFIVGARISRVFDDHFEGYFVVQNLFDKNYEEQVGFPAEGRMLFVGLRYSLLDNRGNYQGSGKYSIPPLPLLLENIRR